MMDLNTIWALMEPGEDAEVENVYVAPGGPFPPVDGAGWEDEPIDADDDVVTTLLMVENQTSGPFLRPSTDPRDRGLTHQLVEAQTSGPFLRQHSPDAIRAITLCEQARRRERYRQELDADGELVVIRGAPR